MPFGVRVELDVQLKNASKIRSQIQKSVEGATQGNPIKIRHLQVDLGRQEAERIARQLEGAIASKDLTIKIKQIDASDAVNSLKKQLTTMLSGLSITGLKDFIGADGTTESLKKATDAANKFAEAQENAGRAYGKELGSAQSKLNSIYQSIGNIGDAGKLDEYIQKYREIQKEINGVSVLSEDAQESEVARITAATFALNKEVEAQREVERAMRRGADAAEQTEKKKIDLARQYVQFQTRIESWIKNNPRAYKANKDEIDALMLSIQDGSQRSASALAELKRGFENINRVTKASGIAGKSFFDFLKSGWEKFGGWSIVTKSMSTAVRMVKSMVNSVIELDSAMTELKKVTSLTSREYDSFLSKSTRTAKTVGSTISDTVNATADFSRLGFSVDDAALLAEASLIYKNVGDGIDDISIATESLISTIKAFNIEAKDSMYIVDMFNEVGNNFAVSSSGIGEALQRSASALHVAGNTIQESIGLVAAANSIVQNPESVGTALKTLTMYIRAAKTEAEEAGIETDGMASSVSELRDEIKALTGVDIMWDDENFKSTFRILLEISKAWDTLSDATRSNVLNLLGSKRNANVLSGLIDNFEDAEEAAKAALGAAGSAMAENEKYLDSINGKISVLKAKFEEFANSVIGSDLVKFLVDIASGFMSIVTELSKINTLLPVLTTFSTLARGISNSMKTYNAASGFASIIGRAQGYYNDGDIGGAKEMLKNGASSVASSLTLPQYKLFKSTITDAVNNTKSLSEELKKQVIASIEAEHATKKLVETEIQVSKSARGLTSAFSSWNVTLIAISAAISIGTMIIDGYNKKVQESIDKANEISKVYSEADSSYKSNVKTLESLKTEFNKLSAGVDDNGKNISLTSDEYDRYLSIIDQIISISPSIVTTYDDQGRAVLNYKDALSDAISKQEEFASNARTTYIASGYELFEGTNESAKIHKEELEKYIEDVYDSIYVDGPRIRGMFGSTFSSTDSFDATEFEEILKKLNIDIFRDGGTKVDQMIGMYEHLDEILVLLGNTGNYTAEKLGAIKNAIISVAGPYAQLQAVESQQVDYLMEFSKDRDWFSSIPIAAMDEFKNGLTEVNDVYKDYNYNTGQAEIFGRQFSHAFSTKSAKGLTDLAKGLKDGTTSVEEYSSAIEDFRIELENIGLGAVADLIISYFESLNDAAEDGASAFDEYADSIVNFTGAVESLNKGYSMLSKAIQEMKDGGGLSNNTIHSILSELDDGEDPADYLYTENGLIKLNIDNWERRTQSIADSNLVTLKDRLFELETEREKLEQIIDLQKEAAKEKMDADFGNSNVDLANRKMVSAKDLKAAGWDDAGTGTATIFTSTYTAGSGDEYDYEYSKNVVIDITPILPDGSVLSPYDLENYIGSIIDESISTGIDINELDKIENGGWGLMIDIATVEGTLDEAVSVAAEKMKLLHELQEQYYALEINGASQEELKKSIELQEAILNNAQKSILPNVPTEINNIGTEVKDLLSAMEKLENGTALSANEFDILAGKYEGLRGLDYTDDIEGQMDALSGVIEAYNEQCEAIIDNQIAANEASLAIENLSQDEIDGITNQNKWLNSLKDGFDIKSIFGSDQKDTTISAELADLVEYAELIKKIIAANKEATPESYLSTLEDIQKFLDKHPELSYGTFMSRNGLFNDFANADWETMEYGMRGMVENLHSLDGYSPGWDDTIVGSLMSIAFGAEETADDIKSLADVIGGLEKSSNVMANAQIEMAVEGTISADTISTIESMLSAEEKLSDYLKVENGLIQLNTKAWRERNVGQMEAQLSAMKQRREEIRNIKDETFFSVYWDELQQLNKDIALYEKLISDFGYNTDLSPMFSELDGIGKKAAGVNDVLKELNNSKTELSADEIEKLSSEYEEMYGLRPDFDTSTLEGQTALLQAVVDLYEQQADAIIDAQIAENNAAINYSRNISEEKIAQLQAMNTMLEKRKAMNESDIYADEEKTEKQAKSYSDLADAMSKVSSAASMISKLNAGGAEDYLSNVQGILEFVKDNPSFSIDEFLDENFNIREINIDDIDDRLIQPIITVARQLGIYTPELRERLKENARVILEGSEKVDDAMGKMTDTFSLIDSMRSFELSQESGGTDLIDQLNQAMNIAEEINKLNADTEGYTPVDWTSWIGSFDAGSASINWTTDAMRQLVNAEIDAAFNGTELAETQPELIAEMKKTAVEATEAANAYDAFSNALSAANSASSLLTDIRTGSTDVLGMIDKAANMAKDSGLAIDRFFTIGHDGMLDWQEGWQTDYINSYVDAISKADGTTNKFSADQIATLKNIMTAQLNAAASSEVLSNAISGINTASSLLTDMQSGEGNILDMLNTISDMAAQSGQDMGDFYSFIDGSYVWNTQAVIDWANSLIDRLGTINGLTDGEIESLKGMVAAEVEAANIAEKISEAYGDAKTAIEGLASADGEAELTYDSYQKLIDADERYASVVEYQNGVLTINADKYSEVTNAILEDAKATAKQALAASAAEKANLDLMAQQRALTDEEQARLNALNAQISGYRVLISELDNATDAYSRYNNAPVAGDSKRGSLLKDMLQTIKDVTENKDSDIYGMVGLEKFKIAKEVLISPEIDVDSPEFAAELKRVEKYIEGGLKGANKFIDDLKANGFISEDNVLDAYLSDMAEALNISEPLLRGLIDQVNQYLEEPIKVESPDYGLDEVETAIQKTNEYLNTGAAGITKFYNDVIEAGFYDEASKQITGTVAEIANALGVAESTVEQSIANLESSVDGISRTGADATEEINDKMSVDEAITELNALTTAISELNPAQISIEITNEDGTSMTDAVGDLAENISDGKLKMTIDVQSAIDNIQSVIDNGNGIIDMITKVGESRLSIDITNAIASLRLVISAVQAVINRINAIPTAKTTTVYVNRVGSGGALASGNAMAGGNANAMTSFEVPGGRTLTGEQGAEIVVDPNTNQWYTVGDNGAEFVNLPHGAIVFNARQTRELLGTGRTQSRGLSLASGNAAVNIRSLATNGHSRSYAVINTSDKAKSGSVKLPKSSSSSKSKKKSSGSSGSSSSSSVSRLEEIKKKYEELNAQTEHLIAHQEFLYDQAEKGFDYSAMGDSLQAQAELYKKIIADSQAAISEMIAAGANDTNEELQNMEEAYWSAYRSLYDTLDKINDLYVDALNDKIDNIQTAFDNLKTAAEEFNNGGISIDAFQDLLENGVQYMSLLENVNGQYIINAEGIQKMIAAQKEQLAIEAALSYIQRLKIALSDNEANATAHLVNLTEALGNGTWDIVYAQAALLRGTSVLTEAQYARVIANIDALKAIAGAVNTDISKSYETIQEQNDSQIDALEEILSLTEDLIKAEAEDKIDAINDEIDAYKEIIDLKKESLRLTKDEDDYTESVAEKTKEIARLQTRIDQLRLDDSREARAERAKLEEDLTSLQKELGELQDDHSFEQQEKALDDAAKAYEDARKTEIDAIEDSISSAEKVYQAALKRLDTGWESLYQDLINWNTEAGSSLNKDITENWEKAAEAVKVYGSYVKAVAGLKQRNEDISNGVAGNTVAEGTLTNIPEVIEPIASTEPTVAEPEPAPQPIKKVLVTYGSWNVRSKANGSSSVLGIARGGDKLEYRGQKSGSWYAVVYNGKNAWISDGGSRIIEELPTYHTGGVAGNKATGKDKEVLSVLKEGELILTDRMKQAAYKLIDFKQYLEEKLGHAIGSVSAPISNAIIPSLAGAGNMMRGGIDIGQMNFNPTFKVEINHSGEMTDNDARRYGKMLAATAADELYESFRQRGIGKLFGTRPPK